MTDLRQLLLDQMAGSFNTPAWQPHLLDVLEDLNLDAALHTTGDSHPIWETVNHLIYWNYRYLLKFRGEDPEADAKENDQTFSIDDATEDSWEEAKQRVIDVFQSWIEAVSGASDKKLLSTLKQSTTDERDWWKIISDMNLHNSYHIGQILTMRKVQGNWINKY